MADFNQSPLNQPSIGLEAFALSLGSAASGASTRTSTDVSSSDGSGRGETVVVDFGSIRPAWRRESKIVSSRQ